MIADDIVIYAPLLLPNDDTSLVGGAVDTSRRILFDIALGTSAQLEAVSDSAFDVTQTLNLRVRLPDLSTRSQIVVLNGTTPVAFDLLGTVDRVLEARLSAVCAGSVTVRALSGGATVGVIPPGERGFVANFRNANPASVAKTYHEPVFVRNNHAQDTLSVVQITEQADPSGFVDFAVTGQLDDEVTIANRLTAPSGLTFDNLLKTGPNIGPGQALKVWLRLNLPADEPAFKDSYSIDVEGLPI